MVAELNYLTELSWLSLMLLLGVVVAFIAQKFKFPNILLLLVIGTLVGQLTAIEFAPDFIASLGIFALVMIIFESTSKFKPREIAEVSPYSLKLFLIFFCINLFVFTIFTHLFFNGVFVWKEIILSVLFAAVMVETSPDTMLSILSDKASKVIEVLELESILNTPFTIIIPVMILKFYLGVLQTAEIIAISFLQEVMTGVGAGLVIGLIVFRAMKGIYMERLSSLMVIAVALITYTLADYIGGNGVLAVTTLGVVFGMSNIIEKESLQQFVSIFTDFLKIVVFILLGLLIRIPWDKDFLVKSVLLFVIYIFIRLAAVSVTFRNSDLNFREKLFLSLNVSKGIAVAIVAFVVSASVTTPYIKTLLTLMFLFIFYSIIVSSFTAKFSSFFLQRPTSLDELKGIKKKREKAEKDGKEYREIKVPEKK